jgi:hypothetical protein
MGWKMSREEFEARALHTLEESYTVRPTPRNAEATDAEAAETPSAPSGPAATAD